MSCGSILGWAVIRLRRKGTTRGTKTVERQMTPHCLPVRSLETKAALRGSPETFKRQWHSEIHAGRREQVCGASGEGG